jgi:hypothetical protein
MKIDDRWNKWILMGCGFFIFFLFPQIGWSFQLDPSPISWWMTPRPFSVILYRQDLTNFYWYNAGIPPEFFSGSYSANDRSPSYLTTNSDSFQYGISLESWIIPQVQLHVDFPIEINSITNSEGVTDNLARIGDMSLSGNFLLEGNQKSSDWMALEFHISLPTGTNPFKVAYPFLSTGTGVLETGIGGLAVQHWGLFSFFQKVQYQQSQPLMIPSYFSIENPGMLLKFQWPSVWSFTGRVQYLILNRSIRPVYVFYQIYFRRDSAFLLNGNSIYGPTDVVFSTIGSIIGIDPWLSIELRLSYFLGKYYYASIPGFGPQASVGLIFKPF